MSDRFTAPESGKLFDLLVAQFASWSRNTLRERLRKGCVQVDGAVVGRGDHPVAAGAEVTIGSRSGGVAAAPKPRASGGPPLPLVYIDPDLLAVDKPSGLLSVSTDDEHERTALVRARQLLPGGIGSLWPVHRLDRDTSGVLLFARSRTARDTVQASWREVKKRYVAIVAGCPAEDSGTIDAPLWEDQNLRVRVGGHADAKPARTHWRVVHRSRDRAWLEIDLDTGRKHQIRAHLAHFGHPVLGDERYGTAGPRLCLHALDLSMVQPTTRAPLHLVAPVPAVLRKTFGAR